MVLEPNELCLKDEGGGGRAAEKGRGRLVNWSSCILGEDTGALTAFGWKSPPGPGDAKVVRFKTWMDMEDTGWP